MCSDEDSERDSVCDGSVSESVVSAFHPLGLTMSPAWLCRAPHLPVSENGLRYGVYLLRLSENGHRTQGLRGGALSPCNTLPEMARDFRRG